MIGKWGDRAERWVRGRKVLDFGIVIEVRGMKHYLGGGKSRLVMYIDSTLQNLELPSQKSPLPQKCLLIKVN